MNSLLDRITIQPDICHGKPVIRELKRISTPGRRVYNAVRDLKPYRAGLGISIVSTPQGVMSDSDARAKNVGGEVICRVF